MRKNTFGDVTMAEAARTLTLAQEGLEQLHGAKQITISFLEEGKLEFRPSEDALDSGSPTPLRGVYNPTHPKIKHKP